MCNSTAMQTVRSASCLSTCNHVRRATLITAPGALRDDVSSLTLPSGRARLSAADPELERLNTLALVLEPPPQSARPAGKPI